MLSEEVRRSSVPDPRFELDFSFLNFTLKSYVLDLLDLYECFFPAYLFVGLYVCVCPEPTMSGEGVWSSGTGATGGRGSPHNARHPGALQEQQVLLTPEPLL